MAAEMFSVKFDITMIADLRRRLSSVRWSDAVTSDWQYGMNKDFLMDLVTYWRDAYDFRAAERRLNVLPQFRTQVTNSGIHYAFLKGHGANPEPLLLLNGWPSSFAEFAKLAPQLADPRVFGTRGDVAFDVVMPALPGFGFSDRRAHPDQVQTEDLFHSLMTDHLGYERYVVSGTDIGAGIATRLAMRYDTQVSGIHIAAVVDPPLGDLSRPLSGSETAYLALAQKWEAEEGAYEHEHYTRPQTLAFALSDSPIGLASWIVEKFYSWSDHGKDLLEIFTLDFLIDNLMVYWSTESIGSCMRYYFDSKHYRAPLQPSDRVRVPTAVCMWPADLVTPPREWAERFYNVRQYSMQAHGGHFPAWEAPDAYARDLRNFVESLRTVQALGARQ